MAQAKREKPKAITLTDRAAARVKQIMENSESPMVGLRLGLKEGGCAGFTYDMAYAEAVNPLDELVEDKGVKVLIDPKAILYLLGTEMDYEESRFTSGFVFNNPNEADACGCGESVSFKLSPEGEMVEGR